MYYMDEPSNRYAKWNKSDILDCILYDIYRKCIKRQIYENIRYINDCPVLGGVRINGRMTALAGSGQWWKCSKSEWLWLYTSEYTKNPWIMLFKLVKCMVCELYQ